MEEHKGKYAVIAQKHDGENEFFLIENPEEFLKIPPLSICFETVIGNEEEYKLETDQPQ